MDWGLAKISGCCVYVGYRVCSKGWPSAAFCWGRISSEQRSLGGSVGTVRKGSRTVAVARGPKGNEVKVFLDGPGMKSPRCLKFIAFLLFVAFAPPSGAFPAPTRQDCDGAYAPMHIPPFLSCLETWIKPRDI